MTQSIIAWSYHTMSSMKFLYWIDDLSTSWLINDGRYCLSRRNYVSAYIVYRRKNHPYHYMSFRRRYVRTFHRVPKMTESTASSTFFPKAVPNIHSTTYHVSFLQVFISVVIVLVSFHQSNLSSSVILNHDDTSDTHEFENQEGKFRIYDNSGIDL